LDEIYEVKQNRKMSFGPHTCWVPTTGHWKLKLQCVLKMGHFHLY